MTTKFSLQDPITPSNAPSGALETARWFDKSHTDKNQSPIDEFRENLYEINKLYLQANARKEYSRVLGSLAYLGMVSAFESYIRALLRRLVLVDDVCRVNAEKRLVTYAAATNHDPQLLPEALLEDVSFASVRSVALELKTLCSITQMGKDGQVPTQLKKLFDAFESICQIRHCGVHRFGRLGSNQALKLGMALHKPVLEKPLNLTIDDLQDIALALEALACGVNSYCFADIIKRTYLNGPAGSAGEIKYEWTWQLDFAADEERFTSYYRIFASTLKPHVSPDIHDAYDALKDFIASKSLAKSKA